MFFFITDEKQKHIQKVSVGWVEFHVIHPISSVAPESHDTGDLQSI